jgi:hypothetical protein
MTAIPTELALGAVMPDGTIYAGVSPDTGRPMFATPKDAPLTLTFDEAAEYAKELDAQGHKDWRVPAKAELNVLFQNRAAIGASTHPVGIPPGGIGRLLAATTTIAAGRNASATDISTTASTMTGHQRCAVSRDKYATFSRLRPMSSVGL